MKSRRALLILLGVLIVGAGVAAALLLTGKRDVTTTSDEAYAAYREGTEAERRYYFKEAQLAFARALQLDPDFAMAMLGLARQVGGEQAETLVKRADRLRNRLTERERMNVDLMMAAKNGHEKAFQVAEQIRKKYPQDIRSAHVIAGYELSRGNMDRAMRIYHELLEMDPNIAEAYNMIGYYHAYRGDYELAIENLKKYQFMAPDQANPHDSLGEVQANFGRYDEAIANLQRALKTKPDFSPAYDHLGVVYEGKGDTKRALEHYRKAGELAVSDGERRAYHFKELRVALRSGNKEAMKEIFHRIEALPKEPELEPLRAILLGAGRSLWSDGDAAAAEAALEKVKPQLLEMIAQRVKEPGYKPYDAGFTYMLARAKQALGKEDEALALFRQMTEPPNPWRNFDDRRWVFEARAELAALLAKRGEFEKAEALLEANRRWNPSWAPTREAELTVARLVRERVLTAAKP